MKRCTKCKINKSFDEFSKKRGYKDGHCTWCKLCCRKYQQNNRERFRQAKKKYNRKLKRVVLNYYGNKCICCGEQIIQFLTIDHINGNGCRHRKKLGVSSGSDFYKWLIDNNFPGGFQILCFNCNCGKSVNGGICPHKERNR